MSPLVPFLLLGILFFGSIQHITIPLLVVYYPSQYFVFLITSVVGAVFYAIIYLGTGKATWPDGIPKLLTIGSLDAVMCVCFIISSNPKDTPVILQSILLSSAVIINAIFSRFVLGKQVIYNWKRISVSLILLALSVIVSVVPIITSGFTISYMSIFYFLGIIFMSLTNVLQEGYLTQRESSVAIKLALSFYTTLVQAILAIASAPLWHPFDTFWESLAVRDWIPITLLFGFVIVCAILTLFCSYMNEISSNYTILSSYATTQSVAIFFLIFPSLNRGIASNWQITLTSVSLSLAGVFVWIWGETGTECKVEADCNDEMSVIVIKDSKLDGKIERTDCSLKIECDGKPNYGTLQ